MNRQDDPLALPSPMKALSELHADVTRTVETLKWLKMLAIQVSLTIALTLSTLVEVFARAHFGERYLSIGRIAASFVLLQIACTMLLVVGGRGAANGLMLLSFAFLLMAGVHRVQIAVRNGQGVLWHSFCPGESFFLVVPWPDSMNMNPWRIGFLVEPVAVVGVGFVLTSLDLATGIAVMLSGVAMLAVTTLQYQQYRDALLNRIDAQIESEVMAEALEGKPMTKTKGFVVPGAKQLAKTAIDYQQAAAGLDPELRELIEGKPSAKGGEAAVVTAAGAVPRGVDSAGGIAASGIGRSPIAERGDERRDAAPEGGDRAG